MQQKTQRPVQFEITQATREAVAAWIARARLRAEKISVLMPLAQRALEQGREVTQGELEAAMVSLDANVAILEALIAAKKAGG